MKPRCKYRYVLFLSLLLLGEEFARAKPFNEEESGSSPADTKFNDDTYQEENQEGQYDTTDEQESPSDEEESEDQGSNWFNDEQSGDSPGSTYYNDGYQDTYPVDYGEDTPPPPDPPPPEDDVDDSDTESGWPVWNDEAKNKAMHKPLVPQSPTDECAGRKGWILSAFKALKIGAKILNYGTTIVSLGASIYQAVEGCAGRYPDAKKYHDDFLKQKDIVEKIAKEADDIQYESQIDQTYIEDSADLYGRILCKLNEIDTESDTLLQTISPLVIIASLNASEEIMKLVEEKNKTAEKVQYLQVEGLFNTKLQTALSVGMSALALAIPAGIDIFKYSRKRYKERKMGSYEVNAGVEFEAPKTGALSKLKETRFGQWIGRSQARFKTKMIKTKRIFNIRFSKIKTFATRFKKGLGVGLNLAMAGYQLYETIKSLKDDCKQVLENAKSAYEQVMNATNTINAQMADIKKHRKAMDETWRLMRGNITEPMFLKSVNTTKTVMEKSSNKSEAMLDIARKIGIFLSKIKTSEEQSDTYNQSRDLYNALIKVPFAFVCYKNKIKIINNVVSQCKDGVESLPKLLKQERDRFDSNLESTKAGDPRYCKDDMGIDYLTNASIIKAWEETAKSKGYSQICFLNDQTTANFYCDQYKHRKRSVEEIASGIGKDVEDVQEVIQALPEGLTDSQMNTLCNLKKLNVTDAKIEIVLKALVRPEYQAGIKELIATVDCSIPHSTDCLPANYFNEITPQSPSSNIASQDD